MPSREAMFKALCGKIVSQSDERVQLLYDLSNDVIGVKRQRLLDNSKGEYIVFVDDDDDISDNYVKAILDAVKSKPDCIGIKGIMTTDGLLEKEWEISKDYQHWNEKNGVYYRHTNHISPVKREIALSVGFPAKNHGEDYDYSMGLKGKLKTEVCIEGKIYHYKYVSRK